MQIPVVHIQIAADGHPRTINRNVKVHMLAKKHRHGVSIEELAQHYEITLADVYAALAYYHDNRDYFDERERQAEAMMQQYEQDSAELRAKVEQRLADMKSDNDE
jgi:uncharacterized protein (DUF433 family)